MNVKLHTPKTLKTGSGFSSAKQFFLSLLATTVSIVLTFGTAAIIDHHKKEASKKEMVKMIISDFDKTIEQIMVADTVLREASRLEQEIALHPEYYDSLRFSFGPVMTCLSNEFSETVENIFSSSIETFSTISNVNFVNEVSKFYIMRRKYKESVVDRIQADLEGEGIATSLKALFDVDFPEHHVVNWSYLVSLKGIRDKCMRMMNVSEEDLKSFNEQQITDEVDHESVARDVEMEKEMLKAKKIIYEAQDKLKN
jgi:hypothetical protein